MCGPVVVPLLNFIVTGLEKTNRAPAKESYRSSYIPRTSWKGYTLTHYVCGLLERVVVAPPFSGLSICLPIYYYLVYPTYLIYLVV